MNENQRKRRGDIGEEAVARYLEERGCTVLARKYRAGHGEVDIIAEGEHYLVFVEVKARGCRKYARAYGRPADAVNEEKRQRIISAAEVFLRTYTGGKQPRLDVAEVYLGEGAQPSVLRIAYFPGAFQKQSNP